mgnify:CR=1 FL=1
MKKRYFNCHDIERTTKIFYFLVWCILFHEEMPKQNIKDYIKSFFKSILKTNFSIDFKYKEPELLGEGWENIL